MKLADHSLALYTCVACEMLEIKPDLRTYRDYIGKLRHGFDQFFNNRDVICLVNNHKGFGSSSWPGGGQETQE